MRQRFVVDVHLLLLKEGQVLLGQRQNTGFGDGYWHLPAGHLEASESLPHALAREAREELGIEVEPAAATLVHVMHHVSGRVGMFFAVDAWRGDVQNMEPVKCPALGWHDLGELPPRTVGYARHAIASWVAGREFSVYGWAADDLDAAA